MLARRQKPEISRPALEDLATRRQRQSIEGLQEMKEYRQAQQAVYERTAALRKERLARELEYPKEPPMPEPQNERPKSPLEGDERTPDKTQGQIKYAQARPKRARAAPASPRKPKWNMRNRAASVAHDGDRKRPAEKSNP